MRWRKPATALTQSHGSQLLRQRQQQKIPKRKARLCQSATNELRAGGELICRDSFREREGFARNQFTGGLIASPEISRSADSAKKAPPEKFGGAMQSRIDSQSFLCGRKMSGSTQIEKLTEFLPRIF